MKSGRTAVAAVWAAAAASCAPSAENPLAGEWTVVAVRGNAPCVFAQRAIVAFGEAAEGQAGWTAAGENCRFDGQASYRVSRTGPDGDLRLATGPWRPVFGVVVEGRVERHGPDRFRYELDGADQADPEVAPAEATTVVFVRKVN